MSSLANDTSPKYAKDPDSIRPSYRKVATGLKVIYWSFLVCYLSMWLVLLVGGAVPAGINRMSWYVHIDEIVIGLLIVGVVAYIAGGVGLLTGAAKCLWAPRKNEKNQVIQFFSTIGLIAVIFVLSVLLPLLVSRDHWFFWQAVLSVLSTGVATAAEISLFGICGAIGQNGDEEPLQESARNAIDWLIGQLFCAAILIGIVYFLPPFESTKGTIALLLCAPLVAYVSIRATLIQLRLFGACVQLLDQTSFLDKLIKSHNNQDANSPTNPTSESSSRDK